MVSKFSFMIIKITVGILEYVYTGVLQNNPYINPCFALVRNIFKYTFAGNWKSVNVIQ